MKFIEFQLFDGGNDLLVMIQVSNITAITANPDFHNCTDIYVVGDPEPFTVINSYAEVRTTLKQVDTYIIRYIEREK